MNRRRSRASVNRSQAGIRSRRRRLGVVVPPRASDHPLHESSSETQSAKTGSNPTAAHGFSAARLLRAAVFQGSQAVTMQRLRPLSTPTYPQRTAPRVTAPALPARRLPLPPIRAGAAPRSAVAELGVVRRLLRASCESCRSSIACTALLAYLRASATDAPNTDSDAPARTHARSEPRSDRSSPTIEVGWLALSDAQRDALLMGWNAS